MTMGRKKKMSQSDFERLQEALPCMTDWDKMLEELERLDEQNPYLRELAPKIDLAECVAECRNLFGEDFLPGAVRRGHPFLAMVPVPMGTAPAHLRWFVDSVRLVRTAENWEGMRSGLTSQHKFNYKTSELELAANFVRGGFEVKLEPRVIIGDKRPEPDMLIRSPTHDAVIYVEVTSLSSTEDELPTNVSIARLGRKILSKAHGQLPKDARGLLFVYTRDLFGVDFEITRILDFVRTRVSTHPTMLGVFFMTGHYAPGVKTGNGKAAPGFPFYRRQRADGVCRDYILVPNPRHLTYLPPGLWAKVVDAL